MPVPGKHQRGVFGPRCIIFCPKCPLWCHLRRISSPLEQFELGFLQVLAPKSPFAARPKAPNRPSRTFLSSDSSQRPSLVLTARRTSAEPVPNPRRARAESVLSPRQTGLWRQENLLRSSQTPSGSRVSERQSVPSARPAPRAAPHERPRPGPRPGSGARPAPRAASYEPAPTKRPILSAGPPPGPCGRRPWPGRERR